MSDVTAVPVDLVPILDDLQALLGPLSQPPRPLDGGITNRNYRVTLGGAELVVRLPGKDTDLLGISREAERIAARAAAELGLSPDLVAAMDECTVTRYVTCTALAPADLRAAAEELGRMLRRFHDGGPQLPAAFDVPSLLDAYETVVHERQGELPRAWGEARQATAAIAAALGPPAPAVPCHNDLLAGNLIRDGTGHLLLVDWEYAGMGERYFDLGNLAVNNDFDSADEERLLHAYLGAPPDRRSHARLRLARVLSDAREAAWGVVQDAVSDLDFDFAGYAREHFERLDRACRRPEFSSWLDDARA